MNVTYLTGEYPPMQGGIADYTTILARHLQQLGVEPSVLISKKYEEIGGRQLAPSTKPALNQSKDSGQALSKAEGVDSGQIPVYPAVGNWNYRCWREIKHFLTAHPTDILHIQYQAAAFDLGGWVNWLPWYLRRWKKRPEIVTTFHDLRIPYLFPKAGKLRWKTVLALARYSNAVICTNTEDAITLRQFDWGRRVVEIPLGNNIPVNPPSDYDRRLWREKMGLSTSAFILAYFGFLNESKGGEELIATLDVLVRQGMDAHLLMIGGDVGDSDPANVAYARRVKALIAEKGLSQRIIFTGYVDLPEVSANLLVADVAVMPYRDGVSFRRTTLIAVLRHGIPVISTTPSIDLPQIVEGQNMLLVTPGDSAALSKASLRVANNPSLRQRLSQGGRELSRRFDWPEIVASTKQLYTTLKVEGC